MCFFDFLDSLSGIIFIYKYFYNFMDVRIFQIGNLAFSLILLYKTCTDDTGWNSDDTNAKIGDADCHNTTQCCDWVNISIADSEKRRHTPPDSAEAISENGRLRRVLYTVHAKTAGKHQNHYYKNRRKDLIFLNIQYCCNYIERIIFCIQPEQMENSCNPKHTENNKTGEEESRNNRQQINNSIERHQKVKSCLETVLFRLKIVRCPDTQNIFYTENKYSYIFYAMKIFGQKRKLFKSNPRLIRLLLSPICIMLNIFSFIKCKSRILYNLNSAYPKRYYYENRILTKKE